MTPPPHRPQEGSLPPRPVPQPADLRLLHGRRTHGCFLALAGAGWSIDQLFFFFFFEAFAPPSKRCVHSKYANLTSCRAGGSGTAHPVSSVLAMSPRGDGDLPEGVTSPPAHGAPSARRDPGNYKTSGRTSLRRRSTRNPCEGKGRGLRKCPRAFAPLSGAGPSRSPSAPAASGGFALPSWPPGRQAQPGAHGWGRANGEPRP